MAYGMVALANRVYSDPEDNILRLRNINTPRIGTKVGSDIDFGQISAIR